MSQANEIMFLKSDDNVMTVMRYFNWSIQKLNDKWYDNMQQLRIDTGLDYDTTLVSFHPEINASMQQNNNGMCGVCFCEFDEESPARSLECGH